MLHSIFADLHIHTCLSPCASLDMTPKKIVAAAQKMGLDLIAVTDHNSAENVTSVIMAAQDTDLHVIPGFEITTSEEAHIIALFGTVEDAMAIQKTIFDNLQPGENDEELFGMQVIANELDEVEGFNKKLLIGATGLSVDQVVNAIHKHNGLAIAAHIDREAFSLISQLGFIPPDLSLDGVEISKRTSIQKAIKQFSMYNLPMLTSSDSHEIDNIGSRTTQLLVEAPTFEELRFALAGENGRKIISNV